MTSLLVASGGGHLTELCLLAPRLQPAVEPRRWVTYEIPQAASLLADEEVTFGYWPTTRNVPNAMRNLRLAGRLLDAELVERVVSTGAGIAVPFLLQARRRGVPCHYIECSTRVTTPSLSGRILERIPGVHLYSQYGDWQRRGWRYSGSVYDHYRPASSSSQRLQRIVVVLGTHRYPFTALVSAVRSLVADTDTVVWQLGSTHIEGLPGDVHDMMPATELDSLLHSADVVIGHAGVGTALSALQAGKVPVLVPRRKSRREHVDDHQVALAAELDRRGLAVRAEPDTLTRAVLERAAAVRAEPAEVPPFVLAAER